MWDTFVIFKELPKENNSPKLGTLDPGTEASSSFFNGPPPASMEEKLGRCRWAPRHRPVLKKWS
jgi:hypothetical protein